MLGGGPPGTGHVDDRTALDCAARTPRTRQSSSRRGTLASLLLRFLRGGTSLVQHESGGIGVGQTRSRQGSCSMWGGLHRSGDRGLPRVGGSAVWPSSGTRASGNGARRIRVESARSEAWTELSSGMSTGGHRSAGAARDRRPAASHGLTGSLRTWPGPRRRPWRRPGVPRAQYGTGWRQRQRLLELPELGDPKETVRASAVPVG
jgi:hypothetical protein